MSAQVVYWRTLGDNIARRELMGASPVLIIDPDDTALIERIVKAAGYAVSDALQDRLPVAIRKIIAEETAPRCDAHLNLEGADFQCVEPAEHGGAHRHPEAQAVWGGPA